MLRPLEVEGAQAFESTTSFSIKSSSTHDFFLCLQMLSVPLILSSIFMFNESSTISTTNSFSLLSGEPSTKVSLESLAKEFR